jgi:hypothetical protein
VIVPTCPSNATISLPDAASQMRTFLSIPTETTCFELGDHRQERIDFVPLKNVTGLAAQKSQIYQNDQEKEIKNKQAKKKKNKQKK